MNRILLVVAIASAPFSAFAMGLQPIGTSASVNIEHVRYDLEVHGELVAGRMEVSFRASEGLTNSANLRFPLPTGSVLHKAQVYLAAEERWETAETLGRREGENIFNDIVDPEEPDDPLLVQQIGVDFYRARVFPIDTTGSYRIRIYYAHVLERTSDHRRLQVALANENSFSDTPTEGLQVFITLHPSGWMTQSWDLGDDLARMAHVNMETQVAELSLGRFSMDRDVYLHLRPVFPTPRATALIYDSTAGGINDYAHISWAPELDNVPDAAPGLRNVVFVIDVSGSMGGRKLEEAKRALETCLKQIGSDDRYGLVSFSSNHAIFRSEMSAGTDTEAAIEWVQRLVASGGTNLSAGVEAGLSVGATPAGRSLDLLLISDGLPNDGLALEGILKRVGTISEGLGSDVRIFGVGIGADLDQRFLNQLAHRTGGEATFSLSDGEIHGQVVGLFDRARSGGFHDNKVEVVAPGIVGDAFFTWRRLFSGTLFSLAAEGELASDLSLELTARTPAGEVLRDDNVMIAGRGSAGVYLVAAPLAAKAWADRLERRIDEGGETDALVNEAVVLAKTFGIVTRYSSLLALETNELYAIYGIQRVEREAAGIALEDVTSSAVDESRIGGAGTVDATGMVATEFVGSTADCKCSSSDRATGRFELGLLMLFAAFVLRRYSV